MQHRHIHTDHLADPEFGSRAALESVLERGTHRDIRRLYQRVWADPYSDVASLALELAPESSIYGTPVSLKRLIEHRRQAIADE